MNSMSKQTQTILLVIIAGLVAYQARGFLPNDITFGLFEAKENEKANLEKKLKDSDKKLKEAVKLGKELEILEKKSLPSDTVIASSRYRDWLLRLLNYTEFKSPKVDSSNPVKRKGGVKSIAFSVSGSGTLDQLTNFMFEFYRADFLHMIRSIGLNPSKTSNQIDIRISIDTLVLPKARKSGPLKEGVAERLASLDLKDYASIANRNLFGGGSEMDDINQTYLTAIPTVNDKREAWFTIRSTDKVKKIRVEEPLEVGTFKGKVLEINEKDVIIESNGERWLVSLGENLDEAYAIPPEF
jgi:hypothetical protein